MLSRSKKIFLFLLASMVLATSIFFYELVLKKRQDQAENEQRRLINFKREDINYITIEGGPLRIVLQKESSGWMLIEPIQDEADQLTVNNILDGLLVQNSKKLNLDATAANEYKMDRPVATWNIKTSLGESIKVLVSGENNFEGYPFIQVASSQDVNLGNQFWKTTPTQSVTFFRHKKLIRSDIELVDRITVSSLSNKFELSKKGLWSVEGQSDMSLDQSKVKNFLMKFFDLDVQDYISDGEPSQSELKSRGLDKNYVQIDIGSGQNSWSAKFNLDSASGHLYGYTNRPTQLIQLDALKWEMLANLSSDQFRDRQSVFKFNPDEVAKFYLKNPTGELEIIKKERWTISRSTLPEFPANSVIDADLMTEYLREFSMRELDYFLEKSDASKLAGNNMIILKSESDQLLMQLNWGPALKRKIFGQDREFFLARTQQEPTVFGLAPESIKKFLDFKFIKKEQKQ